MEEAVAPEDASAALKSQALFDIKSKYLLKEAMLLKRASWFKKSRTKLEESLQLITTYSDTINPMEGKPVGGKKEQG